MKLTIGDFFEKMLKFFPDKKEDCERLKMEYYEHADTIIIEDVLMPEVIKIINKNEEKTLLRNIFLYFEIVSKDADEYLLDVFMVTVLEILGNDKKILETAKQYMGEMTTKFQREADIMLGREV